MPKGSSPSIHTRRLVWWLTRCSYLFSLLLLLSSSFPVLTNRQCLSSSQSQNCYHDSKKTMSNSCTKVTLFFNRHAILLKKCTTVPALVLVTKKIFNGWLILPQCPDDATFSAPFCQLMKRHFLRCANTSCRQRTLSFPTCTSMCVLDLDRPAAHCTYVYSIPTYMYVYT